MTEQAPTRMTVRELMDRIRTTYAEWQAALDAVPRDRLTEPGVAGDWSVKDIIAHITWSEREMRDVLRSRRFAGSDLWRLSTDERNAATYEENRDRSLEDVQNEQRAVHDELMSLIERLTDDELNDGSRFAEMPPTWNMALVLPGNTHKHYSEHADMIREWLDKRASSPS